MKVLLINSKILHVKHKTAIPLGLLSIATFLTANGHDVRIFDRTVDSGSLQKQLDDYKPDIVGISALGFLSFDDAIKLSKALKSVKIPVFWGGHTPSLLPDIVLKSGLVDYVIIGEGEITILDLLKAITDKTSLHDVDGLAFIENGEVVICKEREFTDLSQMPVIDFGFVNPEKYFSSNVSCERMQYIYTSRGCTGNCTFCYSPSYSKCKWRPRPPEHYLSEIKYLVDHFKMDGVYFVDDLFIPNREYLSSVCNRIIESKISFVWGCEFRADLATKEDIQLMYDAGCRWLFFGIESGSEKRQKTIKKRLNLTKTKETIGYCNEIGIVSSTSFIINYPDETEEELKETIRYMDELQSSVLLPSFYGPIPKSEGYESLIQDKRMKAVAAYTDCIGFKMMDLCGENYSKIPVRELKVVFSYYLWLSFLRKYPNNGKNTRVFAKRAIVQTIDLIKKGTFDSMRLVIMSAKEFIDIVYYASLFPGIRKKYGLNKKNSSSET